MEERQLFNMWQWKSQKSISKNMNFHLNFLFIKKNYFKVIMVLNVKLQNFQTKYKGKSLRSRASQSPYMTQKV